MRARHLFILLLLVPLSAGAVTNLTGWGLIDFDRGTNGRMFTTVDLTNAFVGPLPSGMAMRYGTSDAQTNWPSGTGHAQMFLTNAAVYPLAVPVNIGGTYYAGSTNLGMRVTTTSTTNIVFVIPIAASNACVSFFVRFHNPSLATSGQKDLVMMVQEGVGGAEIMCIDATANPTFFTHQANPTEFGSEVSFTFPKWYWVTTVVEGPSLNHRVKWYDPANSYALVGESVTENISSNATITGLSFGLMKYSGTGGVFDMMFDYCNIVIANIDQFPLIPFDPPPVDRYGSAKLEGPITITGGKTTVN